jgi:hypothetical protein
MTETFRQHVARVVGQEAHRMTPDDWAHITDATPRLYYLVRYYPHAAQHDYYLVREGNTRVELPGYRGPDAQWTWDECERVDSKHRYKRVLVEE